MLHHVVFISVPDRFSFCLCSCCTSFLVLPANPFCASLQLLCTSLHLFFLSVYVFVVISCPPCSRSACVLLLHTLPPRASSCHSRSTLTSYFCDLCDPAVSPDGLSVAESNPSIKRSRRCCTSKLTSFYLQAVTPWTQNVCGDAASLDRPSLSARCSPQYDVLSSTASIMPIRQGRVMYQHSLKYFYVRGQRGWAFPA